MKFGNIFSIVLFSLLPSISVQAQNLVPNFSFEQYTTCPNSEDQIHYAVGWSKYSGNVPFITTPDYFNACAPLNSFSLPENPILFQLENRNCGAYVGLCTFCTCGINYREQVGIQLSSPLVVGQKYFLSFQTVVGEYWLGPNLSGMSSNNIGLRLSTVTYNALNPVPIDNFAHLQSQSVITDTINWTRVSGNIIADSAYQYLIVGNFFDDINTDTTHYTCSVCLNYASFYLVDDICVSTDSTFCNGGLDLLPCFVSLEEMDLVDAVNIYPNPTIELLTVAIENNFREEIIISDVYGKVLQPVKKENKNEITFDLRHYTPGIYFVKVHDVDSKNSITKKIIKL